MPNKLKKYIVHDLLNKTLTCWQYIQALMRVFNSLFTNKTTKSEMTSWTLTLTYSEIIISELIILKIIISEIIISEIIISETIISENIILEILISEIIISEIIISEVRCPFSAFVMNILPTRPTSTHKKTYIALSKA